MLPKQLDSADNLYKTDQIVWFDSFYKSKTFNLLNNNVANVGRSCCGGRQACVDQDYKQRHFQVSNKFPDWYCSVNEFFLFVKQVNGEVYVNKDCKMNFNGTVGPIGNLSNTVSIINELKTQLTDGQPIIQCKKSKCLCGLCAPKAKNLDTYQSIMKKYRKEYHEILDVNVLH
jgi:hypothetical protein